MKKLISMFAFIGIVFVLGTGIVSAQTAVDVTDKFYATLGDMNISGLPNKGQLKDISPFLSRDVIAIIKRDKKKQAAFLKKHPDEKPPWAEGDLFSSSFEGRTSYQIGESRTKGSTREVDIYLHFVADTDKIKWTDTAVLKNFSGKWLVTNILFKGKWQFKSGSSLLNALK